MKQLTLIVIFLLMASNLQAADKIQKIAENQLLYIPEKEYTSIAGTKFMALDESQKKIIGKDDILVEKKSIETQLTIWQNWTQKDTDATIVKLQAQLAKVTEKETIINGTITGE